jgi:hypothetical protein
VELLDEVTLQKHTHSSTTRVFVGQIKVDELKAGTSQIR